MGKLIDLTGQRFGSLVVIGKSYSKKVKHGTVVYWKCRCDCGNVKDVNGTGLRGGRIKTCGNHKKEYIGNRYGRLRVIGEEDTQVDNAGRKYRLFKCQCDCGNIVYVKQSNLVTETRSCGCLKKEMLSKKQTKHGMYGTRIHNIYTLIKQRCGNPNNYNYKNYGGRGIKVCDEWCGDGGFERFVNWAKNNGYNESLTIDRIDNNGDYTPENCRWTTQKVQSRNRRTNVFLSYKGDQMIIKDFSDITGINRNMVSKLLRQGLTGDQIAERYSI